MARTRKRFWAKTLTLTAALLAVVWVVSLRVNMGVSPGRQTLIRQSEGRISCIRYNDEWIANRVVSAPNRWFNFSNQWDVQWRPEHEDIAGTHGRVTIWHIPLWPFVLLTGVPGVWMLVKTRTLTNPNACPACGYDRTGLPQTSTGPAPCPECGPECGKSA